MSKYDSLFDKHNIPAEDRPALADYCETGEDPHGKVSGMLETHPNYQAVVEIVFGEYLDSLQKLGKDLSIEGIAKRAYPEIFDQHNIPAEDHPALLKFVTTGEYKPSSEFAHKLDTNPNYQDAVSESMAKLFAPFQEALKALKDPYYGYGEILEKHGIPENDREHLIRYVQGIGLNSIPNELMEKIDSDSAYQAAADEMFAKEAAPVKGAVDRLLARADARQEKTR